MHGQRSTALQQTACLWVHSARVRPKRIANPSYMHMKRIALIAALFTIGAFASGCHDYDHYDRYGSGHYGGGHGGYYEDDHHDGGYY